jgi:hypothetical protein
MREDVRPNKVILAVAKAIEAKFDRGGWIELGILTDTWDVIENHGRLLRSLNWNDPDYHGNVFDVVPTSSASKSAASEPSSPTSRSSRTFSACVVGFVTANPPCTPSSTADRKRTRPPPTISRLRPARLGYATSMNTPPASG